MARVRVLTRSSRDFKDLRGWTSPCCNISEFDMPISWFMVLAVMLALLAGLWRLKSWLALRGERVVTCPDNGKHAGVKVDVRRAGAWMRMRACSRWPEKAGCGQECLRQVEKSPAECLVRTIAEKWYAGRSCATCGRPIGQIQWGPSQPALLSADKKSMEWKQVSADQLHETLEAAAPLCFACHMANTLVREHPELVTERPATH